LLQRSISRQTAPAMHFPQEAIVPWTGFLPLVFVAKDGKPKGE
jgi:hypothetical protein